MYGPRVSPGARRKSLGDRGEDLVSAHLQKKGAVILERNFRTAIGEVDIIARDGSFFCFVEVKNWDPLFRQDAARVLGKRKMRRMRALCLEWLGRNQAEGPDNCGIRFDLAFVNPLTGEVDYLDGALDHV